MSDPAEIDRRVKGTEYWMLIEPGAPQQRTGVLGSLNMSADSFRLLPKESETTSVWTATNWAETRRGWIFITSRPTMREALRPLISLWIDTLVLRLLNEPMPDQRPVWFVIDELAICPGEGPAYPVLWASTESHRAPFGQVIPMEAA